LRTTVLISTSLTVYSTLIHVLQYSKGTLHQVTDCLSRLPLSDAAENTDSTVESVEAILTDLSTVLKDDFKAASCPELTELRIRLQTQWTSWKSGDQNVRAYYLIQDELTVVDDFVVKGTHRLIVPLVMRKRIIDFAH